MENKKAEEAATAEYILNEHLGGQNKRFSPFDTCYRKEVLAAMEEYAGQASKHRGDEGVIKRIEQICLKDAVSVEQMMKDFKSVYEICQEALLSTPPHLSGDEKEMREAGDKFAEAVQYLFDMRKKKGSTSVMKNAWNIVAIAMYDFKTKLATSESADKPIDSESLKDELKRSFLKAVELIKQWHNMGSFVAKMPEDEIATVWGIYYEHSPEMKEIREALSKLNNL